MVGLASQTNLPVTWRIRTANGIPYRILSIEGSSTFDESRVTERYLMAYGHVVPFIFESFPVGRVVNGLSTVNARALPGAPRLLTRRVSWRMQEEGLPIDPLFTDLVGQQQGAYQQFAEVTIEYDNKRKKQDDNTDLLLEVSGQAAGGFLHTTSPKAKWQSAQGAGATGEANKESHVPVTIVVPQTEWTIKWDYIKREFFEGTLMTNLRDTLGKINSVDFNLLFKAKPESVLFVGFSMEERFLPENLLGFSDDEEKERDKLGFDDKVASFDHLDKDINFEEIKLPPVKLEMKFVEKHAKDRQGNPRGHNDFYRPSTGEWEKILIDGVNPVYSSSDFNLLFRPVEDTEAEVEGGFDL